MTMIRSRLRRQLVMPDIPAGHVLNPLRGYFSVIVPVQRTNLVTNPSLETGTTGYTASGASIAQSSTRSYYGAYSLAITPTAGVNDGAYYAIALTSGTFYAFSCRFWGLPGVRYQVGVTTTVPAALSVTFFTGTGDWQWITGYYLETASTTRRIYFAKNNHTSTGVFYVDGVQVEAISAGETVSTYIDGDQAGLLPGQVPYPYYWTGTPHASTSVRLATTRAGGMVVNLDRYLFTVLAFTGLGLTTVANIATPPATTDGSAYQTTIARSRSFTINGQWSARTLRQLDASRSSLYSAVGPDGANPRQPSVLLYQAHDGLTPTSKEGRIIAGYDGGLEGKTNSPFGEAAPITFTQYVPAVLAGESGVALAVQTSVANANAIAQRAADGTWSAMTTGMTGLGGVYALTAGLDGTIYAGGSFSDAGGSGADNFAKWNGSAWAVVKSATSIAGEIRALATGPDGRIYLGGNFLNADGIAAADRIAVYDPVANTFAALGTGASDEVFALAFGPDGSLYAAGNFLLMSGVANTVRIAKWDGANWTPLSTGIDSVVKALAVAPDGSVYAGGNFANAGGTAAAMIARWNGSAWSALGAGITGGGGTEVKTLLIGASGVLYVGGNFLTAGGLSVTYFAFWTGGGWGKPAGGDLNNFVYKLGLAPDGKILLGGAFTTVNGITYPDSVALWTGSTFTPLDIDLPSTATVQASYLSPTTGQYIVGYDTTGAATAAGITSVTNTGTARAYPTLTVTGPATGSARIYQLLNATTGRGIFLNLTMSAGETVTIRATSQGATLQSTFRGDVSSAILPGSSQDFALVPGVNSISFFASASTVAAVLRWPNSFQSVSDLAYH